MEVNNWKYSDRMDEIEKQIQKCWIYYEEKSTLKSLSPDERLLKPKRFNVDLPSSLIHNFYITFFFFFHIYIYIYLSIYLYIYIYI